MSGASTQAIRKRRVRWVRDSEYRVIEIREWDWNAQKGNYLYRLKILRDPTTKMILGFHTARGRVTQADLDTIV